MQVDPFSRLIGLFIVLALAMMACTPPGEEFVAGVTPEVEGMGPTAVTASATPISATIVPTPTATATNLPATATPEPVATATPAITATPTAVQWPPRGTLSQFSTDFSIHSIPYSEIFFNGPPKDGIPAIDNPQFVGVGEANEWLGDLEPVTVFQEQTAVRIYPFQILTWHEIVNDTVGGRPIVVTYCPLCNTAIVFDATVNGRRLTFGATGRLRFSNLLMYDRQTESWWQQASGEAVVGELTGSRLTFLPTAIISWAEAREKFPQAEVLSRETGFERGYGRNPYRGYDDITGSPVLFDGETPDQLPAMARVTTVELNGEAVAYPNQALQEVGVVNDTVGDIEIVVFWQPGLASALDSGAIATGRDVGANGVFERVLNGQTLTFRLSEAGIQDEQTGSTWNIFGEAVAGALTGQRLTPVVKVDHFWFSWAAFRPDTRIYQQP
jgi:hypothetical protein